VENNRFCDARRFGHRHLVESEMVTRERPTSDLVRLVNLATLQMRFWLFSFRSRDAFEIRLRRTGREIPSIPEKRTGGKTSPQKLYSDAP
jgi:hypothetical protein